jgi:DNA-binding NarL/FixJ family response regulator
MISTLRVTTPPIKLLVVDSQQLVAEAFEQLFVLKTQFRVVGTAQALATATLQHTKPTLILISLEHGSTDIFEMLDLCRSTIPSAKILVLSCHLHPTLGQRIINAGAHGYIIKDIEITTLIQAMIDIYNGSIIVDPRVGIRKNGELSSFQWLATPHNLSDRELEVLRLLTSGYSNREISIALELSEKTIKNHVSHIFAKLHVKTRTKAMLSAIENGLA